MALDDIKCSIYKIMFTAWKNLGKMFLVSKLFLRSKNRKPRSRGKHTAAQLPSFYCTQLLTGDPKEVLLGKIPGWHRRGHGD